MLIFNSKVFVSDFLGVVEALVITPDGR